MNRFISLFVLVLFSLSLSAQSYDEWVNKSFDQLDNKELEAAAESLKSAMRVEPGNPQNFLYYYEILVFLNIPRDLLQTRLLL